MAWLTTDAEPMVKGWGAPPQLSSPNIASLVAAVLEDRRKRDLLTQGNISDTIKNVRGEMQANKFLDALKDQELIPSDYEAGGVGGATLATKLAQLKADKTKEDYMKPYYEANTNEAQARADAYWKYGGTGTGRGRGGSSSSNIGVMYDEENDPEHNYPIEVAKSSKIYQDYLRNQHAGFRPPPTTSSVNTELAGYGLTRADIINSARQHGYVRDQSVGKDRSWQEATDIEIEPLEPKPGMPKVKVPIEVFRRWKREQGIPDPDESVVPSPGPTPGGTPSASPPLPTATPRPSTPPPSDQAGGHAPNYGTPSGGSGTGQAGDLIPGVSKRWALGKGWVWSANDPKTGKPGWVIDPTDPRNR